MDPTCGRKLAVILCSLGVLLRPVSLTWVGCDKFKFIIAITLFPYGKTSVSRERLPSSRDDAVSPCLVASIHRALTRRNTTLRGLSGRLSSKRCRHILGLVVGYGNRIVLSKVNGSKRINHGVSTALTSANAPDFFVRPTRTFRNSLNVVAPCSLLVLVSTDNRASRVLGLIPSLGGFNGQVVTVAGGKGSALTGGTSTILRLRVTGRAYPGGLTPAASAALAVTVNSTLTVTVVRRHGFVPGSFTHCRPNNSLNHHLLAHITSIVRRSIPTMRLSTSFGAIVRHVADKYRKVIVMRSTRNKLTNVVASNSLHHFVRGRSSLASTATTRVVAHRPLALPRSAVVVRTRRGVRGRHISALLIAGGTGGIANLIHVFSWLDGKIQRIDLSLDLHPARALVVIAY